MSINHITRAEAQNLIDGGIGYQSAEALAETVIHLTDQREVHRSALNSSRREVQALREQVARLQAGLRECLILPYSENALLDQGILHEGDLGRAAHHSHEATSRHE